ncbi:MAG: hypothetical protein V9G04_17085 [Nocardioides sp.]
MTSWGRWTDNDGPSTQGLHRVTSILIAIEAVLLLAFVIADSNMTHGLHGWVTALICLGLLAVVGRSVLVGAWIPELVCFGLVTVVSLAAEPAGYKVAFRTGIMITNFLLASVCVLRQRAAVVVGLSLLGGSLAYAFWRSPELGMYSLDLHVLQAAILVASSYLLESIWANSRLHDDLALATMEAERGELELRLVAGAQQQVRRVLHDDVLSALRTVVEATPGDEEHVRKACRDAVISVEQVMGTP